MAKNTAGDKRGVLQPAALETGGVFQPAALGAGGVL